MALYHNNNRISRIFQGNNEINKIYQDSKLVHKKQGGSNYYIEFEIDSSSGNFYVPFYQQAASGKTYNMNVYVNNVFYGTATGTIPGGYYINGLTGNTAVIKLTPVNEDGNVVGWGRGFGFRTTYDYDNVISRYNKRKLIKILNDPDYAHLETETTTGNYFRIYQYHDCANLIQISDEDMPDTVTSIGGGFRRGQYYGCTELTLPAAEIIASGVTSIGDNFRAQQYYGCYKLIQSATEILPSGITITRIVSNFRFEQYRECSNLRISGHTHSYHFTTLLNYFDTNYMYMFYLSSENASPDNVPKYYLDSTNTTTAPITNLTPTQPIQYLTNRVGVQGYYNNPVRSWWDWWEV
jgi:hypothetical protein